MCTFFNWKNTYKASSKYAGELDDIKLTSSWFNHGYAVKQFKNILVSEENISKFLDLFYTGNGKSKTVGGTYTNTFMDKPFIHKLQHENSCSFSQAVIMAKEQENQLYKNYSRRDLVNFYCSAIQWVAEYAKDKNIVLDRGILTTYAVFGDDYYI